MNDSDPRPKHPLNIICGGLAASAFVAITQLVTRSDVLPWPLFWATVCFAVSIPLLIVFAFIPLDLPRKMEGRTADVARLGIRVQYLGMITSLAGMLFLFFSFGWLPGLSFFVSAIAATVFVLLHAASETSRSSKER